MRDFPQYTAGGTLTKNSEYAKGHEKTFGGNLGENSEYAKLHEIHFRREPALKMRICFQKSAAIRHDERRSYIKF